MVTFDNGRFSHVESHTKLFFGETDRGDGTLYINENCLSWTGVNENNTLTLQYPSISLHAISRDTTKFPHQCLYCLLESADAVDEDERDPEADVTELRFVPQDSNHIKTMYDALTHCQELHPDPEDDDSEDDDLGGMVNQGQFFTAGNLPDGRFFTADNMPENIQLSEEGEAVLQRLQQNMQMHVIGDSEELMNGGAMNGGAMNGGDINGFHDQFDDADEETE